MHRVTNLNAILTRPSHGHLHRLLPRENASNASLRAWMSSTACLQTSLVQAPTRVSYRATQSPVSSLPSSSVRPVRPGHGLAMNPDHLWSSSLLTTSIYGKRHDTAGLLYPTHISGLSSSSRSFHTSHRSEGGPALYFLIPLLKTSTSLAAIKTGR